MAHFSRTLASRNPLGCGAACAIVVWIALQVAPTVLAQGGTSLASEMATRARALLDALTPAARDSANLAFADSNRYDWHYIPRARQGLPHQSMDDTQSVLAHALMDTALSEEGQAKARGIMQLDQVLFAQSGSAMRDSELYYVTVFGEPASEGAWGWRVEGHHLSLNLTIQDGEVISTSPTFMGANPAIVRNGPNAGLQVLEQEQTLAKTLLGAFDDAQRGIVVYAGRPPRDIETGAARRAPPGDPRGLALSAMTSDQAALLMRLVEVYARRLHPELAGPELERIRSAGVGDIYFAWAGRAAPGEPHYYRIQGPTFLIEYDNRQNGANHIHSVWRDLTGGDFGEDVLAKHYAESPYHRAASAYTTVAASEIKAGLLSADEIESRAQARRSGI